MLCGKFAFAPHLLHSVVGAFVRCWTSAQSSMRDSQHIWPVCISPHEHSMSDVSLSAFIGSLLYQLQKMVAEIFPFFIIKQFDNIIRKTAVEIFARLAIQSVKFKTIQFECNGRIFT